MSDLFSTITDQGVMDQTQVAIYKQGVILAAQESTNFFKGSSLINQQLDVDAATASFIKFAALSGGATLTDGVEVTSEAVVDSKATATLIQHGNVVTITDMGDVSTGGRLNLAVPELVGKNMGEYVDKYFIQKLEAGSNEYTPSSTAEASLAATDIITALLFEKAYTFLRTNKIPKLVDGLYVAVIHPHVLSDIRNVAAVGDWVAVSQYQNSASVLRNEVGMYKGFKIIESANVTVNTDAGSSAVDTYHTSFFGYNALGAAYSVSKPLRPTFITGTDKLDRFAHIGWKGTFAGCLVDTNASVLVTTASTFGTNA